MERQLSSSSLSSVGFYTRGLLFAPPDPLSTHPLPTGAAGPYGCHQHALMPSGSSWLWLMEAIRRRRKCVFQGLASFQFKREGLSHFRLSLQLCSVRAQNLPFLRPCPKLFPILQASLCPLLIHIQSYPLGQSDW